MASVTFPPVEEQLSTLLRGVVDVHVKSELESKLTRSREQGRPLNIKVGFDPTAPDLHLGHTVVMHKMRQWQRLGHRVTFLIGDFTALIGDPTGRSATRPPLTREEIAKNAETYKAQVFKILDAERTVVRFNSEWLGKLSFEDIIRLASNVTVAQLLEREDFKTRMAERKPLSLHEILYPLSQAYDSVALEADVEMGGSDQLFNLMMGRDLMRARGMEPQCILTMPILEGTDAEPGGRKMSKSYGNYVGVNEPPDTQVLKLMGINDALMWRYYDLLSDLSTDEIAAKRRDVEAGRVSPRDAKAALAMEIVTRFHGTDAASQAWQSYEKLASGESLPDDAPLKTVKLEGETIAASQLAVELGFAKSRREAGERIKQGALRHRPRGGAWQTAGERDAITLKPGDELEVRYGKRDYARVRRA
ncbi:MAG: tyrosine--tRNA ligase [Myxococcota bacterium]